MSINSSRIVFVEPTDLYNIIQAKTHYPSLSDNNYLLILDAREVQEYEEAHIVTAKLAPRQEVSLMDAVDIADGEWKVPYEAEMECKEHIVVYDGSTSSDDLQKHQDLASLENSSKAAQLAAFLVSQGTKNPVKVANGGYERFSALYPFLRTKKILYMPKTRDLSTYDPSNLSISFATLSKHGPIDNWKQHVFYRNTLELDVIITYPTEIIAGEVYMGNLEQALDKTIQKHLKVKAQVAVTNENETFFSDPSKLFRVPVEDEVSEDLLSHLEAACNFIEETTDNGGVVLIYSNLGISRCSAMAIAYLIYKQKKSLKDAWFYVSRCQTSTRPNRGFVKQLSQWEEKTLGELKTNIDDPHF